MMSTNVDNEVKNEEMEDRVMTYEEFKKEVEEKFLNYMPEEYADMKVVIGKMEKLNRTVDTICVTSKTVSKRTASPISYIDALYHEYQSTCNFDAVMCQLAANMVDGIKTSDDIVSSIDFDMAPRNIVYQLINKEQNRSLLNTIPHREFLDLAVVYRWILPYGNNEKASVLITNNLANDLNLKEEELYSLAVENSERVMPAKVGSMESILREALGETGMSESLADQSIGGVPDYMWVISVTSGRYGFGAVMYDNYRELRKIADRVNSDLYVIPSSMHEAIVMSTADGCSLEELLEMVVTINMTEVSLEDRLSNQVYYYDRAENKLSLATNTQYSRLDDMVV